MEFTKNGGPGAPGAGAGLLLTLVVEGDPRQMCRRTVWGTVQGAVRVEVKIVTLGQPKVAEILRQVANEFAASEGALVIAKSS